MIQLLMPINRDRGVRYAGNSASWWLAAGIPDGPHLLARHVAVLQQSARDQSRIIVKHSLRILTYSMHYCDYVTSHIKVALARRL